MCTSSGRERPAEQRVLADEVDAQPDHGLREQSDDRVPIRRVRIEDHDAALRHGLAQPNGPARRPQYPRREPRQHPGASGRVDDGSRRESRGLGGARSKRRQRAGANVAAQSSKCGSGDSRSGARMSDGDAAPFANVVRSDRCAPSADAMPALRLRRLPAVCRSDRGRRRDQPLPARRRCRHRRAGVADRPPRRCRSIARTASTCRSRSRESMKPGASAARCASMRARSMRSSARAKRMHAVLPALCTGCELCLPPCPVDCIDMVPAGTRVESRGRARRERALRGAQRARRSSAATPALVVRGRAGRRQALADACRKPKRSPQRSRAPVHAAQRPATAAADR